MEPSTYLTIDGIVLVDRQMRKVDQTLSQIDEGGKNVRLANARAYSLARKAFRKYKSTITMTVDCLPALSGKWRGDVITVGCIRHREEKGDVPDAQLVRPPVPGSVRRFVVGPDGLPKEVPAGTAGIYMTRYRPIIQFVIDDISESKAEWDGQDQITLTLAEV